MIFKVLTLFFIAIVGIYSTYRQYEKKNYKGIIWAIVGTITLGIVTNYLTDLIRPFLPYPDSSLTSSVPTDDNNKETNSVPSQANTGDESSYEGDNGINNTDNIDDTNKYRDNFSLRGQQTDTNARYF